MFKRLGIERMGRFQQDVAWNMVSLGVVGAAALVLNILIGVLYGPAALGVFNQVFAMYIFFSQFAAMGIHYSALKHVAQHARDRAALAPVVVGAIVPAAVLSACATAALLACRGWIGGLLDSPQVAEGLAWAALGLGLFAVNKVLLGTVNGLRWMKTFALLQGARPVVMLAAFAALLGYNQPTVMLPVVLSAAEAVVFIAAVAVLVGRGVFSGAFTGTAGWMREHMRFGLRSFGGGVLTELNTRVDVLMLGYFATDAVVGVYSFAAILAEGLFQILVVLRNNYNPLLVRYLKSPDREAMSRLVRRGKAITYGLMLVVGAAAVLLFPLGVRVIGATDKYLSAWPMFATLTCGIVLVAGYVPFGFVLVQAGRPGVHTLMTLGVVAFNIVANAALIPLWEAQGAAVATAAAFVFNAVLLVVLTRRVLRFRL